MALVVSAVSSSLVSISAYAEPSNGTNMEVSHIQLSNSPKILNTELKDAYGTVEYRINYDTYDEEAKKVMNDYLKNIKEVTINNKKISEEDSFGKHYYGISLDPKTMTNEEN